MADAMRPGKKNNTLSRIEENAFDAGKAKELLVLKLLSSRSVLWPFLAGLTCLAAVWTFSFRSVYVLLAGLAALLVSTGVLFTKYLLGGESLAKKVVEELEEDAEEKRNQALDELEARLTLDGDSRTERCLRDLRTLSRAFKEQSEKNPELDGGVALNIVSGVEQLFKRCVQSLEKSLDLWYTARDIGTPEAKQAVLKKRNAIIVDVCESISQLGNVLAEIQGLVAGKDGGDAELPRLNEELERSLEVAKKVEERMKAMDDELRDGAQEGNIP